MKETQGTIEKEIEDLKKQGLVSKLVVTDAQGDANTQIQQIQSMIDANVDAIVLIAGSSTVPGRVIGGTYELMAYMRALMRLQTAADCLADLATRSKTISPSDVTNYCNGAKLALNPYPTSTFTATVASVSNTN